MHSSKCVSSFLSKWMCEYFEQVNLTMCMCISTCESDCGCLFKYEFAGGKWMGLFLWIGAFVTMGINVKIFMCVWVNACDSTWKWSILLWVNVQACACKYTRASVCVCKCVNFMVSMSIFICKHMSMMLFVIMLYLWKCTSMWLGAYRRFFVSEFVSKFEGMHV